MQCPGCDLVESAQLFWALSGSIIVVNASSEGSSPQCRWQGSSPGGIQQQGGRPPRGRQQPGPPQSQAEERDPWAELQGEASRAASRGPPPGGFRGGFSGGFQGRSRELLNLKQRQVLTAPQPSPTLACPAYMLAELLTFWRTYKFLAWECTPQKL